MVYHLERNKLEFSLDGRVFGLVFRHEERPKHLSLATMDGKYSLRLSTSLRQEMPSVQIGDWIRVTGEKETNEQTGACK